MDDNQFGIWPKQAEVLEAVRDAPITGIEEIFMIGPVGSSKTFAMAAACISVAWQFADSIIPVGRKDLSEAQLGTWSEFMRAIGKMGFVNGVHYTTRQAPNDLRIKFGNDSIIQFIGMNKSRDPDWAKLKITATMAAIDEVDDVDETGYDFLFSRTGRRNETGAPRVTISACNPNDRWTKTKIYLPWLKRLNRRPENIADEEWGRIEPLSPSKMVIEFTMEDSPLCIEGHYDRYVDRPRNWRERFLYNNWMFVDDENSLFRSRAMDTVTISRLKQGDKYIAVDPNAGGKDRACICLMEGDTLVDIEVYTTEQLKKKAEAHENPENYGAILGRLTIDMAERERVPMQNIGCDVVGIGQGWLTYMLSNGYSKVLQFRSGDAPIQTPREKSKSIKPPYFDLRSQMFWLWATDINDGNVYFYADTPHLSTLKKELQFHEADSTSKVIRVTPKDEIRKLLGGSPDIADAAMMVYWVRHIRRGKSSNGCNSGRASVGRSVDELYYNQSDF